jgi:hypothetical protein
MFLGFSSMLSEVRTSRLIVIRAVKARRELLRDAVLHAELGAYR